MTDPDRVHEGKDDDHASRRARGRRVRRWSPLLVLAVIVLGFVLVPNARKLADFAYRVGEGAVAESSVAPFYDAPTRTPSPGSAPRCAPSSGIAPFVFIEGLTDLLAAGNIVAATDYSGMGIAGPPSYLIGATEAANVLDIVRAARTMDDVDASNRVMLWGHSRREHAALFAAQETASYAPALDVAGVAVAAPATAPGWSELLAENSPTVAPLPMPLFVAQGAKDTLVRPAITAAYATSQQQAGTNVESRVYPDQTHATIATAAVPDLLTWIRALP